MIARLRRRVRRPGRGAVCVHLRYADGGSATLGPMTRDAADLFLALRVAPDGAHAGRRVASARIVA